MIKCEKDRKEIPTLQEKKKNILLLGEMIMAVMMESATFMGKNFQNNQNSIVNTADLTLKQMFDRCAKLVGEQDEISSVDKIDSLGQTFMETSVIDWWRNRYQSSTRQSLCPKFGMTG